MHFRCTLSQSSELDEWDEIILEKLYFRTTSSGFQLPETISGTPFRKYLKQASGLNDGDQTSGLKKKNSEHLLPVDSI